MADQVKDGQPIFVHRLAIQQARRQERAAALLCVRTSSQKTYEYITRTCHLSPPLRVARARRLRERFGITTPKCDQALALVLNEFAAQIPR
jgi:hypothetical protein